MGLNIGGACFDRFIDNLAGMLGENCEIVVMDVRNGYEHSIVKVVNGISGRAVGDTPSNLFFENLSDQGPHAKDSEIYYSKLPNGKILKTLGMFLRDDEEKIVGAVNVSIDVTDLINISRRFHQFVQNYEELETSEVFTHTLDELMDHYLEQVEIMAGKPAHEMNRAEKMEALRFLDAKGVLHMSKSSIRLCKFFGFSKYTLYSYLDEIRGVAGDGETEHKNMDEEE